jgi:hypothetical protein
MFFFALLCCVGKPKQKTNKKKKKEGSQRIFKSYFGEAFDEFRVGLIRFELEQQRLPIELTELAYLVHIRQVLGVVCSNLEKLKLTHCLLKNCKKEILRMLRVWRHGTRMARELNIVWQELKVLAVLAQLVHHEPAVDHEERVLEQLGKVEHAELTEAGQLRHIIMNL